ncbi:MAG: YggS family pyridoxal phosphate-dependent enzyme [Blautia sp.]|nr:YggS family pyridoxal phosphate-dependent enzyme [Lachnoclostridium sp.]MCM1210878.1 YggS family pyridoxal phosphate-dependent enzyme [Blautia sp.]
MIRENIADVEKRIKAACEKSNRAWQDVTLIAVSKTKPISMLQEAYDAGCRDFGENKVQELVQKWEEMPKDVRWHMIGHLQRNKVKYIVDKVCLIHSVDSLRLAQEISKEAGKKKITVSILIEVNIAEEESKYGAACEEVCQLVEEIAKLPNILVKGLMTVAPYVENPEENRQYFEKLRQIYVDIIHKNIDNVFMEELSMGMTGDYEVAVTEGATYVRVGTGIFGERFYTG